MAEHDVLDFPHAELPGYLLGIEPPVSTDEALEYARAHGAPPEVLDFIEALPAAVFTSEAGMRHAFSTLQHHGIPDVDPDAVPVEEDGTSS